MIEMMNGFRGEKVLRPDMRMFISFLFFVFQNLFSQMPPCFVTRTKCIYIH